MPPARRARQPEDDAELQARHDHHHHAADEDQAAGAEVGLQDGEAGGNHDEHAEHEQRRPARWQRAVIQPPGAGHGHGQLHDLRGLEADEPEIQPALRALADVAGDVDHHQQHHARGSTAGRRGGAGKAGFTCASAHIAKPPSAARIAASATRFQLWPEAL
jgi:hypothetical protein